MKRRGFLAGLLFAPAIIRTPGLLMPIKASVIGGPSLWLVSWSSDEVYGHSPAHQVLPALRELQNRMATLEVRRLSFWQRWAEIGEVYRESL